MKREKIIFGILAFILVLVLVFTRNLMLFAFLIFIYSILLTFYVSQQRLGAPEYSKIFKEIWADYCHSFKNIFHSPQYREKRVKKDKISTKKTSVKRDNTIDNKKEEKTQSDLHKK